VFREVNEIADGLAKDALGRENEITP